MWAHIVSRIPFSSIQNHDNTEQARIYPAKLKHIVPRRQSAIIAGLNKCKILTGTNASNGSRTRGYIFAFVPLLWLACICVHCRATTQDAWGGASTSTPCRGLVLLAEVDEGRCRYQTGQTARSFPPQIWI